MTRRAHVALVLDEMFSPVIADKLSRRGFDVIAVAADPQLRAMTDAELYGWAAEHGRCILTENVKDFRPILRREDQHSGPRLLFTSSRVFPRDRHAVGSLIAALEAWLESPDADQQAPDHWLKRSAE